MEIDVRIERRTAVIAVGGRLVHGDQLGIALAILVIIVVLIALR